MIGCFCSVTEFCAAVSLCLHFSVPPLPEDIWPFQRTIRYVSDIVNCRIHHSIWRGGVLGLRHRQMGKGFPLRYT